MSANKASRKYGLWIVLVSLLVAGMMATPDLWAAPGRNPRRQTVPPGTLTPTPGSSAPTDEPTSKPTKKPSPSNPTQAPDDTPTFTPVPVLTSTSTPIPVPTTAEAFTATPSASPTVAGTASPTTVPPSTATVPPTSPTEEVAVPSATPTPGEQVVVEDTLASAGVQPTMTASGPLEESHVPAPTLASPAQVEPSDDVDAGSPLFCGGIGMVVMGMVLLTVWRLRA